MFPFVSNLARPAFCLLRHSRAAFLPSSAHDPSLLRPSLPAIVSERTANIARCGRRRHRTRERLRRGLRQLATLIRRRLTRCMPFRAPRTIHKNRGLGFLTPTGTPACTPTPRRAAARAAKRSTSRRGGPRRALHAPPPSMRVRDPESSKSGRT